MNVRDSESVGSLLEHQGYEETENESEADVIIVNTCSVRGKSEDKAIGKLRMLVHGKRERSDLIVGVMGCMVQRLDSGILKDVPGVDFAVGTHRFAKVPEIIDVIRRTGEPVVDVGSSDESLDMLSGHSSAGSSAFVNILFGCNRGCSYCVVPRVRGNERSRAGLSVVEEVRGLAKGGVNEVTLLGQSVMSYGQVDDVWPDDHKSSGGYEEPLARLLEAVSSIDGIKRVRFTSGHPSGCTDELIRAMSEIPEVCEHLHMPVQSGSDRILDMMRRGYSADDYREAAGRLRDAMPDIGLTTDVIVGFPTESEAEFELTRQFMDEVEFAQSFIFKFSPRPGTAALKWDDDVSAEEKLRRNKVLLEDQDRRALIIGEGMIGKTVEVLVQGVSLRNSERWVGRTGSNKIVVFNPVDGVVEGDLVRVTIQRAMPQTLYGDIESKGTQ